MRQQNDYSIYDTYTENLCSAMQKIDWKPVDTLFYDLLECHNSGKRTFICGNGGSAGNANHIANDLIYPVSKKLGVGIDVVSLSSNPSTLTCLANDEGYENIFSYQLSVQAGENDTLVVLSGSGNSPNIINALNTANGLGLKTHAILGFDGGYAAEIAQNIILCPMGDMQISEDFQMITFHMIVQKLFCWFNKSQ